MCDRWSRQRSAEMAWSIVTVCSYGLVLRSGCPAVLRAGLLSRAASWIEDVRAGRNLATHGKQSSNIKSPYILIVLFKLAVHQALSDSVQRHQAQQTIPVLHQGTVNHSSELAIVHCGRPQTLSIARSLNVASNLPRGNNGRWRWSLSPWSGSSKGEASDSAPLVRTRSGNALRATLRDRMS